MSATDTVEEVLEVEEEEMDGSTSPSLSLSPHGSPPARCKGRGGGRGGRYVSLFMLNYV